MPLFTQSSIWRGYIHWASSLNSLQRSLSDPEERFTFIQTTLVMYQEHNITKITTWPEALVPKIETTLPAFLLNRFWRTLEILCMNEIRTLLSIRCMLPRYGEIQLHVNVTRLKLTCGTTSTTRTRTTECIFTTICTSTLVLQKKCLKKKGMRCYFDTIFADRKFTVPGFSLCYGLY